MASEEKTPLYIIERYVRCGEMPLFFIFCRDKRGHKKYCIMLCSHRRLRQLSKERRGFSNPEKYGRLLMTGHGDGPSDLVKEILKARYDFDLDSSDLHEFRVF